MDFETLSIHGGEPPDAETGAVRQPLHMAVTYKLPPFGIKLFEALNLENDQAAHVYTRWSNPTLRALEKRLALLEDAESAVTFASGMAAVSALFFTLLSGGDHVIASEVCYAGTVELLGQHMPRFAVQTSLVDTSDPDQVRRALRPNTRLIYVETPANPVLRIADIRTLAAIAHEAGVPLVVDSTFATPALQKPIALGADYVIHSLTKYLNGHGDALGGVILGKAEGVQRIRREMLVHLGGALSPFNAWLIQRGLETLHMRMQKHCENALQIARFLENHPRVERVFYPGLESHPHHELAKTQMSAFGGMIALRLKGGMGAAITLAEKVKVFTYATSLGHPTSLLFYYPYDLYVDAMPFYTPTHKQRIRQWTGDGLVRISVGLESADDLIADLDQALRGRTLKGLVGPAVYQMMKRKTA
ncbi:MAG: aminotransferase class I/II-fold pyridoxal phosphate-dependent enzyme [Anaerolineae bacterium]|nr:aminotransferase class I/II-fold pyridoxal phosphate-dependent enzyme [Anaerolineae bacterium]